jgi:hypothetical protein
MRSKYAVTFRSLALALLLAALIAAVPASWFRASLFLAGLLFVSAYLIARERYG